MKAEIVNTIQYLSDECLMDRKLVLFNSVILNAIVKSKKKETLEWYLSDGYLHACINEVMTFYTWEFNERSLIIYDLSSDGEKRCMIIVDLKQEA